MFFITIVPKMDYYFRPELLEQKLVSIPSPLASRFGQLEEDAMETSISHPQTQNWLTDTINKDIPQSETVFGISIQNMYPEVLAIIFRNLDVQGKGRAAQVCTYWRDACYQKSVWNGVQAKLHVRKFNPSILHSLVRRGIRKIQVCPFFRLFICVI